MTEPATTLSGRDEIQETGGTVPRGGVLIVGNFTATSNRVCASLAERLRGFGWSTVETSDKENQVLRASDMVRTTWTHRARYRVAQVDVYSGRAFRWAEAACWALRHARKPYVLSLHGGNLPKFAGRNRERVGRLLRSAAAVTSPSPYLAEHLRAFREDILVLPNGLDLDLFPPRPFRHPEARLMWIRSLKDFYVPHKAVEVLALLRDDYPEAHLTIVGPDSGDGSLQNVQQTASRLGVTDRVTLTGLVPKRDIPTWLGRGDIFLNTTRADNTPGSVLEAMASGLCVVSTNVGGVPYLLEDGKDALLVTPMDAAAMAGAVRRLLTDEALAHALTAAARDKVEGFAWPVVVKRWDALLTRVAES